MILPPNEITHLHSFWTLKFEGARGESRWRCSLDFGKEPSTVANCYPKVCTYADLWRPMQGGEWTPQSHHVSREEFHAKVLFISQGAHRTAHAQNSKVSSNIGGPTALSRCSM